MRFTGSIVHDLFCRGVCTMSDRSHFREFRDPANNQTLFFALLLGADDRRRLTTFTYEHRRKEGLAGTPTPRSRLHLSLHAVGDDLERPDRIVRAGVMAGASVDAPAFSVAFDRTMTFTNMRPTKPFVLCASDGMMALESLHERLGQALWRVGLGQHVSRRFTPHITLLYDQRCAPERPISPLIFRFDSFVLIHSLVRPRRHVHVARWSLRQ
jgi:RNA 2',3'-cyclic 3'-phosphodiesterase